MLGAFDDAGTTVPGLEDQRRIDLGHIPRVEHQRAVADRSTRAPSLTVAGAEHRQGESGEPRPERHDHPGSGVEVAPLQRLPLGA